jgi:6-phosphogluconolactonase
MKWPSWQIIKNNQKINWQIVDNPLLVAQRACRRILQAADNAIKIHGQFQIVLAGGRTPELTYHLLKDCHADWSRWHIYYGDERCLPEQHEERNSMIAAHTFLNHVAIPSHQIYPIPAHLGASEAARRYSAVIKDILPFDLVILGIGDDGHTASLFPGKSYSKNELVHAVFQAPKPPPERVSLSATALSNTRELIFLVTGTSKRDAVSAWRRGEPRLPVTQIQPRCQITAILDQAAWDIAI